MDIDYKDLYRQLGKNLVGNRGSDVEKSAIIDDILDDYEIEDRKQRYYIKQKFLENYSK